MIDLMDAMGTTPLESRQNPVLYTFILMAALVLLALLVVYIILRYIKHLHNSQKWIDAHKERETNLKNVKEFSKTVSLEPDEAKLLWEICHEAHFKNIIYSYSDTEVLDEMFKGAYQRLSATGNEDKVALLFALRYKIEKYTNKRSLLSTTRSLPEGQVFTFIDKEGVPWPLELLKNDEKQMELSVPNILITRENQPASLEKISLNFITKNEISYTMVTRVVRYEKLKDGTSKMVVMASNSIKSAQRRMTKRMTIELAIKFYAVKQIAKGKHVEYEAAEKRYPGRMADLSANGCCIDCGLPIKKGQFIGIEFSLDDSEMLTAIGTIVNTKKSPDEKYYVLHIKFERIDTSAKNKIYAHIYNYSIDV